MLGISTCWWAGRRPAGPQLVEQIRDLGFEALALDDGLTARQLEELQPLLRPPLKVVAVHNILPQPEIGRRRNAGPEAFVLSALDREVRAAALAYARHTLEWGQELEAGIVILHLGHVDMPSPTPLFRQLHAKGDQGRGDLEAAVTEQLALRAVSQRRHLDAALFGLERLEREAERRGLWLAVENPGQLHEIPDRAEMAFILQEFKGARIGYWHDVGHAAVQANLGLARGDALLKDFGDRLLGLGIHDAQGLEDHLAPGQGAIDFLALKGVAPTAVRVLEVAGEVQRDDLRRGIATLRALWEA